VVEESVALVRVDSLRLNSKGVRRANVNDCNMVEEVEVVDREADDHIPSIATGCSPLL
jgi:hypothetical protein